MSERFVTDGHLRPSGRNDARSSPTGSVVGLHHTLRLLVDLQMCSQRMTTNPKLRVVYGLTAVLTCDVAWLVLDICSQYLWRVGIALSDVPRYAVCYEEDAWCDARSQNHD